MEYNFDVRAGPISISWFKGGTTNLAYNCLDRNVERGLGDSPCFIWEGNEPGALPCRSPSLAAHLPRCCSVECMASMAVWRTVPSDAVSDLHPCWRAWTRRTPLRRCVAALCCGAHCVASS